MTASVVVNGKTYTDDYTVNVPAGHSISYEYATVTYDSYGEATHVDMKDKNTISDSNSHRKVCSECGLRLSGWEKHEYIEFVNSKEHPNEFVAKCECGKQYSYQTTDLDKALEMAGNSSAPVSVVRVAYRVPDYYGTATVPKNVTLIVEAPFELENNQSLVFTVADGGHIEGNLGENVIVVGAGDEEYKATVNNATALEAAIKAATPVTVDGEQVGRSVSITLNEPEDEEEISLSNSIELPEKADITIDLNGNTLKNSCTANSNYTGYDSYLGAAGCFVVKEDSTLTLKNGELVETTTSVKNNIVVDGGELNLENMKMEFSDGYGIGAFNKGTVNVTGGSIKSKDAAVHTNNIKSDGTHINLDGVKLESTENSALYLAAKASVKVTNCTLTGKNGIELAGGTLEVSNTTINYSVALTNPESSSLTAGTGSRIKNPIGYISPGFYLFQYLYIRAICCIKCKLSYFQHLATSLILACHSCTITLQILSNSLQNCTALLKLISPPRIMNISVNLNNPLI